MTLEQKTEIRKIKTHLKNLLEYGSIDKYAYDYLLAYNIISIINKDK